MNAGGDFKTIEKMKNKEFDSEITARRSVLEFVKHFFIPFENLSDEIQEDKNIFLVAAKTSASLIAFDLYDVCDKEVAFEAFNHPDAFKYLRKTIQMMVKLLERRLIFIQKKGNV